jgi:hypothetical protein
MKFCTLAAFLTLTDVKKKQRALALFLAQYATTRSSILARRPSTIDVLFDEGAQLIISTDNMLRLDWT